MLHEEVLNGLAVTLDFVPAGIGRGELVLRIHLLEEATHVRISLSLPKAVSLVLGEAQLLLDVSRNPLIVPYEVEITTVGEFPAYVLVTGLGGPRELTGADVLRPGVRNQQRIVLLQGSILRPFNRQILE